DLAQDQHGTLSWREVLECGDEGKPNRLTRHGHLCWISVGRDDKVVRYRLDPGHLGQRVEVGFDRLLRGPKIYRTRAPLFPVQHVEGHVGGDAVEPRSQCRPALEALEAPPGPDERLLHGILGVEGRAEHSVAI